MITARDIMTKDVRVITPETSIIEAIDLLMEKRISGLPVVDADNNLKGVVSEKDFLHILFQDDVKMSDTVQRYMSKKVVSFSEDDNVYDICEYFLNHFHRRVPIVNKEGKLSGIVSRRDVLEHILISVLKYSDEKS